MFSERDSTDSFGGFGQRSATLWLTVGFVVVFALQCVNDVYLHTPAEGWLALTRRGILDGWVWQPITFQLLHADFFHLVFNLIVFWWLGHFCEGLMGVRRFLLALFGCGAVGGLLQGALMVLFPQNYGLAAVGASAGVSALLAVFALCERDAEIRLYFVIPVRAIWLLWASLAISAFFTLVPTPREYGVAHAAHLGGLLAGMAWHRMGWHHDFQPLPGAMLLESLRDRLSKPRPTRGPSTARWASLEVEPSRSADRPRRSATSPKTDASAGQELSREVDRILDKMNAKQPLTDAERELLHQAGRRIGRG